MLTKWTIIISVYSVLNGGLIDDWLVENVNPNVTSYGMPLDIFEKKDTTNIYFN